MGVVAAMIIGVRRDGVPRHKLIRWRRGDEWHESCHDLPRVIHCGRWENGQLVYGLHFSDRIAPYYKFVKLYSDERIWDTTVADIDIGYQEERLTPIEKMHVWLAMPRYCDIPF